MPATIQTTVFDDTYPFAGDAPALAADSYAYADVIPFPRAAVADLPPIGEPAADPATCIELCLLGGFRLLVNDQETAVGLAGQRLLSLLACLGRPASRSRIALMLWPDTTEARAQANLRTALHRVQRACPGTLYTTSSHVGLEESVRVDLQATRRIATDILGIGGAAGSPDALVGAALRVNLYDDLLPEWDDEWLRDDQYRHRHLRLDALEVLAQRLAGRGRHREAFHLALAAVQADPLRDSAHETLIRSCLARGNRNDAMTHYSTYRQILQDELGLDPAPEIDSLLRDCCASA
jgi:DNA-binding SARP family transcriptional activator